MPFETRNFQTRLNETQTFEQGNLKKRSFKKKVSSYINYLMMLLIIFKLCVMEIKTQSSWEKGTQFTEQDSLIKRLLMRMREKYFLRFYQIKSVQQWLVSIITSKRKHKRWNPMATSMDFRQNFHTINRFCFFEENLQEDHRQVPKFHQNRDFFQHLRTLTKKLNFILRERIKIEYLVSKFELKSTKNMYKRMIWTQNAKIRWIYCSMTSTNHAIEMRTENTLISLQMFNADPQLVIVLVIDCLHEIKNQGRDLEQMFFQKEAKNVKQRALLVY